MVFSLATWLSVDPCWPQFAIAWIFVFVCLYDVSQKKKKKIQLVGFKWFFFFFSQNESVVSCLILAFIFSNAIVYSLPFICCLIIIFKFFFLQMVAWVMPVIVGVYCWHWICTCRGKEVSCCRWCCHEKSWWEGSKLYI